MSLKKKIDLVSVFLLFSIAKNKIFFLKPSLISLKKWFKWGEALFEFNTFVSEPKICFILLLSLLVLWKFYFSFLSYNQTHNQTWRQIYEMIFLT